jgi:hypothetical protein
LDAESSKFGASEAGASTLSVAVAALYSGSGTLLVSEVSAPVDDSLLPNIPNKPRFLDRALDCVSAGSVAISSMCEAAGLLTASSLSPAASDNA